MIFTYDVKTATSLRNRARSAHDTLNTCQKSGDEKHDIQNAFENDMQTANEKFRISENIRIFLVIYMYNNFLFRE